MTTSTKAKPKSKGRMETIDRAQAKVRADKAGMLLEVVGSWKSAGIASQRHKAAKAKHDGSVLPVVHDDDQYMVMYLAAKPVTDNGTATAAVADNPGHKAAAGNPGKKKGGGKKKGKASGTTPKSDSPLADTPKSEMAFYEAKKGIRAKVFGMTGVQLVKLLGSRGVKAKQARAVFEELGVPLADPTIRRNLPLGARDKALKKIDLPKEVQAALKNSAT